MVQKPVLNALETGISAVRSKLLPGAARCRMWVYAQNGDDDDEEV